MIALSLAEISVAVGGVLIASDPQVRVTGTVPTLRTHYGA